MSRACSFLTMAGLAAAMSWSSARSVCCARNSSVSEMEEREHKQSRRRIDSPFASTLPSHRLSLRIRFVSETQREAEKENAAAALTTLKRQGASEQQAIPADPVMVQFDG